MIFNTEGSYHLLVNRTPSRSIIQFLRREVNFGCPVQGCGIPYLTWHHFDPPWNIKNHHNPEGMVAICVQHAAFADGGRWTTDQLRVMKQRPYVTDGKVSQIYDYLRKSVVCLAGNVAYNVRNILEIDGERVVGFEKDANGYHMLNILIRDSIGSVILKMENNCWTVYTDELFDFSCSARGKTLSIISKDKVTEFTMRFDDYPSVEFGKLLYKMGFKSDHIFNFISSIGAPAIISVWKITGDLVWKNSRLRIEDSIATEMSRSISVVGSFVKGKRSALSFDHGTMSFG